MQVERCDPDLPSGKYIPFQQFQFNTYSMLISFLQRIIPVEWFIE